jgi:hypothetical protein
MHQKMAPLSTSSGVNDHIFFKICPCFQSKTPIFSAKFFGEIILKIITSFPAELTAAYESLLALVQVSAPAPIGRRIDPSGGHVRRERVQLDEVRPAGDQLRRAERRRYPGVN